MRPAEPARRSFRLPDKLPVFTSAAPGGTVAAVEVKAGVHGGRSEARHLFWMRELLGESFVGAALLHTGSRPPHLLSDGPAGRIWSAPVSVLWQ